MDHAAEISRTNPTCFLFLIDQSGSMSDQMSGTTKKKADGVADAINRLLKNLVIRCSKPEVRDYFDIGVIGYGNAAGPAFGGQLAGRALVPISEVATKPARMEDRIQKVEDGAGGFIEQSVKFAVWFDAVASNGTPMCEAFRQANQLLRDWVAQHPGSYPPTVINITDGESGDGDPTGDAKALTALSTSDGGVLLFNCHISSAGAASVEFPDSEDGLPDENAKLLFRISSKLPESLRKAAAAAGYSFGSEARGFVFNADLVKLIEFLNIGTKPADGLR